MKMVIRSIYKVLFILVLFLSPSAIKAQNVTWLSWEAAVNLAETEKDPKKIFVDI